MRFTSSLIAGLAAVALAAPRPGSNGVTHEKLEKQRWIKREAVSPDTKLPVRIALKQRNLDKGMDYLMEVSDPSSPSYGKHYTQEQVVELFAPSDESIETVKNWLVSSGLPASAIVIPKSRGWIGFDATASQVESLLQTKYHVYHHTRSNAEHVGASDYILPEHISDLVDFISPAVAPMRKRGAPASRNPHVRPFYKRPVDPNLLKAYKENRDETEDCGSMITPQCIREMYKIPPPGTKADPRNHMGIYEADPEVYAQPDLDQFFTLAAPEIPKGTHPKANLIGKNATAVGPVSRAGGEATLDYDMAYPLVYPQVIEDFEVDPFGNDLFDTFLDAIDGTFCSYSAYGQTGDDPAVDGDTSDHQCGAYKPTNVISISYGLAEQEYPVNYQKRQCDEYMKLGLQGVSLFLASGDYGVAEDTCQGPNEDIFVADSASACPYMTAVGSTTLPAGSKPGDEETATTSFASGGGFSNIYPRPAYQQHAVNSYFLSHDPGFKNYTTSNGVLPKNGGVYNAGGRGYPDISAVGDNGLVVVGGSEGLSGGTSMSAPIVAAMFNRINEERFKAGKQPVGFINPTIYKHQEMFNDIVKGDMTSNGLCNGKGFSCVRGWDPVTGMGTPKYDKMLEIFLKL